MSEALIESWCKVDPPSGKAMVEKWGRADAEAVVRQFWKRMVHIYGAKFTHSNGEDPRTGSGEEWAMALAELTLPQIKEGIDACVKGRGPKGGWAPTIPEFRLLALGIPSLAQTRLELDRSMEDQSVTRSPFVMLVHSKIDWYHWRQCDVQAQRLVMREVYEECVEHVLSGYPLPKPAGPAISYVPEEPQPKEHDPEVAKAAMEAMKAELGW